MELAPKLGVYAVYNSSPGLLSWSNSVHYLHRWHIFPNYSIQYHLFADNAQMYDHCPVSSDVPDRINRLSACLKDLAVFCLPSSSVEPLQVWVYLVWLSLYSVRNTRGV